MRDVSRLRDSHTDPRVPLLLSSSEGHDRTVERFPSVSHGHTTPKFRVQAITNPQRSLRLRFRRASLVKPAPKFPTCWWRVEFLRRIRRAPCRLSPNPHCSLQTFGCAPRSLSEALASERGFNVFERLDRLGVSVTANDLAIRAGCGGAGNIDVTLVLRRESNQRPAPRCSARKVRPFHVRSPPVFFYRGLLGSR